MNKFLMLMGMGLALSVYAAEDFTPIQEKSLGQSLAGSNQLNDSLYSNPAASSLIDTYSIDGSYSLPKAFAVSVLDTKTSTLGGAIGYFRRPADEEYFIPSLGGIGSKFIQGAKLALMRRLTNNFGLGVSGKSIWGPDIYGKDNRLLDADVGAIYNGGFFQLGASVRNVLGGKEAMKFSREYSMGGRLSYQEILSLFVASQSKFSSAKPYQIGIGAEYISPYYFGIRGGYRSLLEEQKSFWSVGASFNGPKLALHYAVETANDANGKSEHMFGTTLLF